MRVNPTFRKTLGLLWVALYFCSFPSFALSADLSSTLTNFLSYLTGTMGKTVASIAVVGVGFGCFGLGRIPKATVVAVVIGVGLIFGASALIATLQGTGLQGTAA